MLAYRRMIGRMCPHRRHSARQGHRKPVEPFFPAGVPVWMVYCVLGLPTRLGPTAPSLWLSRPCKQPKNVQRRPAVSAAPAPRRHVYMMQFLPISARDSYLLARVLRIVQYATVIFACLSCVCTEPRQDGQKSGKKGDFTLHNSYSV